jgi:hypothetical protein
MDAHRLGATLAVRCLRCGRAVTSCGPSFIALSGLRPCRRSGQVVVRQADELGTGEVGQLRYR